MARNGRRGIRGPTINGPHGETMTDSIQSGRGGAGGGGPPKHQRKLRNYLLDKKFQLKYTGIVIGITAVLSLILGYYLYREIVISQETILARDLATDTYVIDPGDIEKRMDVSDVIDREFNDALQSKLRVVVQVNNAPAGATAHLYEDHFQTEVAEKTTVLVGALGVFLLVLAVVWVYLTHKIAGPVYKLGLLFSKVEGDRLRVAGRLRKGDELQDTFVAFEKMVDRLRAHRKGLAERVGEIAEQLEKDPDASKAAVESLQNLKSKMLSSLDD